MENIMNTLENSIEVTFEEAMEIFSKYDYLDDTSETVEDNDDDDNYN